MNGERGVLARRDLPSPFRVARYGVNREDLERIGVPAIERAVAKSDLVVMDELGRMELCSVSFQYAVGAALDSPIPVLGTIQERHNAFLDSVRDRGDVRVLTVTEFNRDEFVEKLASDARTLIADARALIAGAPKERAAEAPVADAGASAAEPTAETPRGRSHRPEDDCP